MANTSSARFILFVSAHSTKTDAVGSAGLKNRAEPREGEIAFSSAMRVAAEGADCGAESLVLKTGIYGSKNNNGDQGGSVAR